MMRQPIEGALMLATNEADIDLQNVIQEAEASPVIVRAMELFAGGFDSRLMQN